MLDGPSPDLLDGVPRSLVLSLPDAPGAAEPVPPLPDQLGEGVISPPSPGTRIPFTGGTVDPQTVEDSIPTTLPFEFKTSGYRIDTELPEYMRPWRDRPTTWSNVTPNTENVYLDAEGVIQTGPTGTPLATTSRSRRSSSRSAASPATASPPTRTAGHSS